MLTVGSLFSGIGGFDLGLERAGMSIKWQVENNAYCNDVLAKHWPNVTRYGDIKQIDWGTVEPVDLICGGFPCQDLSYAGKRAGLAGKRSGLWSEYVRAIRALRPQYVLVENVPGLLTNEYMGRVLGDLAESGYDAEWNCISARMLGAPIRRERIFIVAFPIGFRRKWRWENICEKRQGEMEAGQFEGLDTFGFWASVPAPKPYGVAYRPSGFMERLIGHGNAIVPQIAEALGRMILEAEHQMAPP